MPTTLVQAILGVRDRLDEVSARAWTDPQLVSWINEGVGDVARRTETIQKSATISAIAGTQKYTAPADMLRAMRATYLASGSNNKIALEFVDFNALEQTWLGTGATVQATPYQFTLWGTPPALELWVYPVPSVAGVIEVFYYSMPVKLASDGSAHGTALSVPEGYADLVLDYATFSALRRDRDARWKEFRSSYEENLESMRDMTRRWADQAGYVTRSGGRLPNWLTGYGD